MNFVRTAEDKRALKYSKKLPENRIICEEILQLLKNQKTKLKLDKNIKSSYYVFINNTIYIADSTENNNLYSRVVLIAHECIHSIQSKLLQVINFSLANVEIITFILSIILKVFNIADFKMLTISYMAICILSLLVRLILEIHAVISSVPLSREYLIKKLNSYMANSIVDCSEKYIKRYMPVFLLSLSYKKIIRMIIILAIYIKF